MYTKLLRYIFCNLRGQTPVSQPDDNSLIGRHGAIRRSLLIKAAMSINHNSIFPPLCDDCRLQATVGRGPWSGINRVDIVSHLAALQSPGGSSRLKGIR